MAEETIVDELDKLLAEDDEKKTQQSSEEVKPQTVQIDEEANRKSEQLNNLTKAIAEAQSELRRTRAAKKEIKVEPTEDELPKIDLTDPSARAWDKHFAGKVDPLTLELEREKEEVRTYALKEFLADKPALSKNPEKVKELVGMYEKLRTATERNKEGVLLDLDRAYAATHHEELLQIARNRRVASAQADALLSDIAVSRGATSYNEERKGVPHYSNEDKQILAKWGMTPEEHAALK